MSRKEFMVATAYSFNQTGPVRWIVSHVWRYRYLALGYILASLTAKALYSEIQIIIGLAFNAVLGKSQSQLAHLTLLLLLTVTGFALFDLWVRLLPALIGQRIARDARQELFLSLLGKSQTFHNRQRVGDIMARTANDLSQLSSLVAPGLDTVIDSYISLILTIVFIGLINWQLLLIPLLFTASFLVAVRFYSHQIAPIADNMREQFGKLNITLSESIQGFEVVKATAQEEQERQKFISNASRYSDLFIENGRVQSWYLPPLFLAIAMVFAFLHGLLLVSQNQLSIGGLVSFMSLMGVLQYPTFNSAWSLNQVRLGVSGAERVLHILKEETELDENESGYRGNASGMRGEIVFEHVSFSYEGTPVLKDISFKAYPGQTIAIVGQTGSGKSTLARLINRIYDVESGRILVDGVDVRSWNLDALRSQISTIEQDIFLFSRSITENIAYGLGQQADREAIERAACDAQAHQFIQEFKEGYETIIGERGVTLSGGQRQRIAIARALLTNPRILILDDSTSAIDSATEDEIQRAIRRVLEGRTTFLITHRLSQIRRADYVLVLRQGELIDQGTHKELLHRCEFYSRIFAHRGQTRIEDAPEMNAY